MQAQQLPLLEARHGLKTKQMARHPVEQIQRTYLHNEQDLKYNAMANVFGTHMVIRHELEKQILGSFQRLPALRSEFCALETITGRDTEMTFGDVFGEPAFREDARQPDVHLMMEAKLGMTKTQHYL
eukprot:TRINITY_DN15349_c0_g1_i1.p2 TRINITY_DN15349_c0_g1~~TRINITY_DN15349_c0_g1_i1.p2  ORF type:complete len:127 (-),score=29.25 TRINITY_DN15349_c0_g1_i1:69-449(-)